MDDDQHDYDSVASDEDTDSELTAQNNSNTQRSNRAKVRSTLALSATQAGFSAVNGPSISQAASAPSAPSELPSGTSIFLRKCPNMNEAVRRLPELQAS